MRTKRIGAEEGQGRNVLVTGCSSGIGREAALALARRGFTVFATVRKGADADGLRALGLPELIPVCPVDLSDLEQVRHGAEFVSGEIDRRGGGELWAVVNNAGAGGPAPVELLEPRRLQIELAARLLGPVALVQAVLPLLRRAGGRIVWIMTPALIPTPYVAGIHTCDFGANCLARTLDIELKPWRIPNIMVRCGGIKTPAGLRTVVDVESLLKTGPPDRVALYEGALRRWAKEMAGFDAKRTEAAKVADVVVRAVVAARPKRRYSVGHMARAAAFLEALPQPLADAVLKSRF